MASMNIEISNLRPCLIISSNQKALWHGIFQRSFVRPPSYLKGGHPGGTIADPVAIVELENGGVIYVEPHDIRFLDNKFKEYCFGEAEKDEN